MEAEDTERPTYHKSAESHGGQTRVIFGAQWRGQKLRVV